jgi:conjugative transfer region protein (TIGR03750 family)
MNNYQDIVTDKLNEKPSVCAGMTQFEIVMIIGKWNLFSITAAILFSVFLGTGFIFIFTALGIGIGCAAGWFWATKVVSLKKAGTPYGYHARKQYLNGMLVKLGIIKVRTIHESRLWRHFK